MKTYEIIREVFVPCTGDQLPDKCTISEKPLVSPDRYVRGLYKDEQDVSFLYSQMENSTVIEVVFDAGGKHRYTFTTI